MSPTAKLLRIAASASLLIPTFLFVLWSLHWPLVGDASLIHYIAFLIERGLPPYRVLGDMNMPGSFLIEMAAMHVFGPGDLAWRLFDFTLLAAAALSFFAITRRRNWFAALFAACLFALIHGRDGLAEGGQRDLTMAVCLLAATAFLFTAVRRGSPWATAAFGLLSGIAVTVKPTAALLTLAQGWLAVYALRARHSAKPLSITRSVLSAVLGYLAAPAICLVFLFREQALGAFIAGFHGIVPYYASLGHRPLSFLLLHSISPLLPLVLLWLAIVPLHRREKNWERPALLLGVAFGLLSCIAQARGLPYYRYPLLAFLLPLMASDFTETLPSFAAFPQPSRPLRSSFALRFQPAQILALAALAFGSFFLAPQSAVAIHRFRWWETDFISSLDQNLTRLGGPALSGRIQCIDSISGCGNALYRLRLLPATGLLSDFLLFGPADVPIIRQTRAEFASAILAHPPEVIVVSSHLHIEGPENYEKLARWPAFASFLAANYTLDTTWAPTRTARWWSREETPAGYRIYVLHH